MKGLPSPGKDQQDPASPIASKTLTGKANFALPGGIDLNKAKLKDENSLYRTRAKLNATPIHEKQTNRQGIIEQDGVDPVVEYEAEIQRERERYEHQAKMRAEANAKRKKQNNTEIR